MKFTLAVVAAIALWAWAPHVAAAIAGLALYIVIALALAAFCSISEDVDRREDAGARHYGTKL